MPRITIPIAQGFYQSPSLPVSNQRCVNFFPNITQTPTAFKEVLFGTPGTTQLLTTGKGKQVNRGSWVKAGVYYFVNGTVLYSMSRAVTDGVETFTANALGTVEGETRCLFSDNGTQLMVLVPKGKGYIIDESAGTVFQEITDTNFTTTNGIPVSLAFIDSFFVVSTDTKKIKKSAANNGLSWAALDFAGADADPDEIVGLSVFRNLLYVYGTRTVEVFENAGLGGFPLQRIRGFVIPKGLSGVYGVVNASDSMLWIGAGFNETPAIWSLAGNEPQKVSTTSIDSIIAGFTQEEIQSVFSFSYAESGGYFVGFTFPGITLVYDLITQRWHERESQIINSRGFTEDTRWRVNAISQAYGRIIVADSQDGRIGSLSLDNYAEYEQPIISKFSTMPLYAQGISTSVTSCELTLESGVGSYKAAPEVRLKASVDGRVFNDSRTRGFGKRGEYGARSIWNRLGRFPRTAVFEFSISDAVKKSVLMLELKIKQGNRAP